MPGEIGRRNGRDSIEIETSHGLCVSATTTAVVTAAGRSTGQIDAALAADNRTLARNAYLTDEASKGFVIDNQLAGKVQTGGAQLLEQADGVDQVEMAIEGGQQQRGQPKLRVIGDAP